MADTIDLSDRKMLVCGGCGFMGSNFIHAALSRSPSLRVVNLDALTYAGNKENLRGIDASRYDFIQGDICDGDLVKKLMADVSIVVNFAAETHVDRSIHSSADAFVRTNVLGVHSLLEALRASPHVDKMVHISTDEVWGDLPLDSKERFTESSPFLPNSPYAASKAAGDLLVRSYVRTHGAPVIVTHSVNNYGPRQHPEKLIPFFASRAAREMPLTLYGDGKYMRDWLYVDDHSEAIFTVIEKGELGDVYNVSQQEEFSNNEIAERIVDELGKPRSLMTYVKDRPAHDRKYAVDSSKLRTLGWAPRHSLDTALQKTIRWFVEHRVDTAGVNEHID